MKKIDRENARNAAVDTLQEVAKDKGVEPGIRVAAAKELLEYVKWDKHWVGNAEQ